MKNAFVTGATGGIGSSLCERLSSGGWRVTALVRPSSETAQLEKMNGVSLAMADLLDAAALTELMRGCDVVFHLAAMVHAPSATPYSDFHRVNVEGTRAVVNAAAAAGVDALVFFSTVAVYPESEESFDESSPVGPTTPYGETKLAAELLALEKRDVMRVTVLRLPVVYGPRDHGNVGRLIAAIANGRFVIPGSGDNVKTMVAVGNVAEAAVLVASDLRAAGKTYIVADDHAATLLEIVSAISRSLGLKRSPRSLPIGLMLGAARLADLLSRLSGATLPISAADVRKLAASTRYDGARICRELGIRPRVGLDEGMALAVAGYESTKDADGTG